MRVPPRCPGAADLPADRLVASKRFAVAEVNRLAERQGRLLNDEKVTPASGCQSLISLSRAV